MGRPRKKFYSDEVISLVDVVTVKGGKMPVAVDQTNGEYPPFALVLSTRVLNRTPMPLERGRGELTLKNYDPMILPGHEGKKWCIKCAEWVDKRKFTAKTDTADKLHPYCNTCRAEYRRYIYYMEKMKSQPTMKDAA